MRVCVCVRERERERETLTSEEFVKLSKLTNQLLGKRGDMRITVRGVSVRAGERRERRERERERERASVSVARRMLSNEAV